MGAVALTKDSEIVDVGGGASELVDRLLDRGFERLTVADISDAALSVARTRLGPRARQVTWLVADACDLLMRSLQKMHTTPSGSAQQFTYCLFRRQG